jgi:hypothetical protein
MTVYRISASPVIGKGVSLFPDSPSALSLFEYFDVHCYMAYISGITAQFPMNDCDTLSGYRDPSNSRQKASPRLCISTVSTTLKRRLKEQYLPFAEADPFRSFDPLPEP